MSDSMRVRSSRSLPSSGRRCPPTRNMGGEPNFRWMSDACCSTAARRIASRSTCSFLPAPPPPHRRFRRRFLCTGPVARRRCPSDDVGLEAELLPNALLDVRRDVGMLAQEVPRVLASLADALAVVGVPGARLLDDALLGAEVDQLALLRDADAVKDVKLGLAERRRDLV